MSFGSFICGPRPDEKIIESVAIEVPGAGNTRAELTEYINTVDHEPVGAIERSRLECRGKALI